MDPPEGPPQKKPKRPTALETKLDNPGNPRRAHAHLGKVRPRPLHGGHASNARPGREIDS